MEICKNKKSGAAFVHLREQKDGRALMISPHGEVKALEYHLFTEPTEIELERNDLILEGLLTNEQVDVYEQYMQ